MKRKPKMTLTIDEVSKQKLERLAIEHGCFWGDKPNLSEFFRAIASGDIQIGHPSKQKIRRDQIASVLSKIIFFQESHPDKVKILPNYPNPRDIPNSALILHKKQLKSVICIPKKLLDQLIQLI